MRWVGHVACMGEVRNSYKILVRKSEGKRPSGIPMHRQENTIRMDLREIGWEGVDWLHLAQNKDQQQAVVNMVNEPSGSIKSWEFLDYLSDY